MTERLVARLLTDFGEIERLWSDAPAVHGAPQSLEWIGGWHRAVNADSFVAGIFTDDCPVLLVPLEVVSRNGAKIARYPGGSHANCNFPWVLAGNAGTPDRDALQRMVGAIRQARPDIDALSLTRQFADLQGVKNPLLALGAKRNPNPVLAASLGGGFDSVLERSNRRRKLKNTASTVAVTRKAAAGELPDHRTVRHRMQSSISILR